MQDSINIATEVSGEANLLEMVETISHKEEAI